MTLHRRAAKRDTAEAGIVAALRSIGCDVWLLSTPCDLLVRRHTWPPGQFMALEVKSLVRKPDARQKAQTQFLHTTGTRIVRTPEQAIEAIQGKSLHSVQKVPPLKR